MEACILLGHTRPELRKHADGVGVAPGGVGCGGGGHWWAKASPSALLIANPGIQAYCSQTRKGPIGSPPSSTNLCHTGSTSANARVGGRIAGLQAGGRQAFHGCGC